MKPIRHAIALLMLAAIATPSALAVTESERAAEAAKSWVTLLDEGKYPESWETASSVFRQGLPKERWVEVVRRLRSLSGKTQSRALLEATPTDQLPHTPVGHYVVVRYDSKFEHGPPAIETVSMMQEGSAWKVLSYTIKAAQAAPPR